MWKPDLLLYNSANEAFDATFPTNIIVRWVKNNLLFCNTRVSKKVYNFEFYSSEMGLVIKTSFLAYLLVLSYNYLKPNFNF